MRKTAIKRACHAHSDLCIFAAIVLILEGGTLYDIRSKETALRIIKTCQREQQRLLRQHDNAVYELGETP